LLSDPHSPEIYRVNGIVRTFDLWYAAFDVKPDNKLYLLPEQRVRVWVRSTCDEFLPSQVRIIRRAPMPRHRHRGLAGSHDQADFAQALAGKHRR
jgi:hypothetical protein